MHLALCTRHRTRPILTEISHIALTSQRTTFAQIANENFNITYNSGEFLTGIVGHEIVTLAGITVDQQEVALVTAAYWQGDSISSGLVGMAYPSLTSACHGTNPSEDNATDAASHAEYSPLFHTMYTQGSVKPLFSIVLERGNGASTLALGGLPPGISSDTDYASTPISITKLLLDPLAKSQHSFYTIYPDGFVYSRAGSSTSKRSSEAGPILHNASIRPRAAANATADTITTDFSAVVDSGTTLMYLPNSLAEEVLELYTPRAYYSPAEGIFLVHCNATAPDFGVTIGGSTFYINAADMIFDGGLGGGICLPGIQLGDPGPYILGDMFLQNVIAVFDVGAAVMKFAAHDY